jgi:hypothetical protein
MNVPASSSPRAFGRQERRTLAGAVPFGVAVSALLA